MGTRRLLFKKKNKKNCGAMAMKRCVHAGELPLALAKWRVAENAKLNLSQHHIGIVNNQTA